MFRRSQVVPLRSRRSNGAPPSPLHNRNHPDSSAKMEKIKAINAPNPLCGSLRGHCMPFAIPTEYSVSPFTHPILAMAATLCNHVVIFRGEEPHRRIHQAKLSSHRMEIS